MSGLTGARENPRFRFMLLDSMDADIRDVSDQIIGGSLSLTTGRLGGSGTLQLDDAGIDFGSQRVRISYDPGVEVAGAKTMLAALDSVTGSAAVLVGAGPVGQVFVTNSTTAHVTLLGDASPLIAGQVFAFNIDIDALPGVSVALQAVYADVDGANQVATTVAGPATGATTLSGSYTIPPAASGKRIGLRVVVTSGILADIVTDLVLDADPHSVTISNPSIVATLTDGVDGLVEQVQLPPWDVGVYLFTSPTRVRDGLHTQTEVGLTTKLQILEEASTVGTANLPTPALIVDTVADLIRGTGETRLAATPASKQILEPYTADADKSLLSICNDLLDAANYWGVGVDGVGQYTLTPYQAPSARSVVWTFTEDEASIISPAQTDERDMLSVPNQFVAYTTGSDDEAPLVGVAQDNRADSPFSISARGRVIEARDQVEAASQSDADAIAARRLLALQAPVGKRSVSHAMIPVRPREVVEHVRSDGTRARFTIQKLEFSFDFDTQMKAEWNEVQG